MSESRRGGIINVALASNILDAEKDGYWDTQLTVNFTGNQGYQGNPTAWEDAVIMALDAHRSANKPISILGKGRRGTC